MPQDRNPSKTGKRLKDMTIHPEPDPVWLPFREGTKREEGVIDLPEGRVAWKMWLDGQQIVDFILLQQLPLDDEGEEWFDLIRVDCKHSEVHIHHLLHNPEKRVVIRKIEAPEDVAEGMDEAYEAIFADWQANVRRYSGG